MKFILRRRRVLDVRHSDADGLFDVFLTPEALAINKARQDHLLSLGLSIDGRTILEVGAGIGLHTGLFIDASCEVVATDTRPENVRELSRRYPNVRSAVVDLDQPGCLEEFGHFDICYCYGTLYHLSRPEAALAAMAEHSDSILLESIMSTEDGDTITLVSDPESFNQAASGIGCRPTRSWVGLDPVRRTTCLC